MGWTAPRTWVAGETPTAANFNTDLRDNLRAIGDPWTAFTPAWTALTTNPDIGDGTIQAAYTPAGKLINFWVCITMGASTTYGSGAYLIGLPVLQVLTPRWAFSGLLRDVSAAASYPIIGEQQAASQIKIARLPTTAGGGLIACTGTAPVTLAVGDSITMHGTYEAA